MADTSCGVSVWRPACLQRFATNKLFIAIFGLLGTVQAMSFVYFIATITTMEKRYQMPSQTMGILMSGNEVSQILLVLILSHLGQNNRPVWIAWGVVISGISCFILATPHFIYGPGPAALALTAEYLNETVLNSSVSGNPFLCDANRQSNSCSSSDYHSSLVPMILVFLSQFVLGIGTSLYFSLGQTYMDDNTKKKNTPMLLGITMSLRTLGPALGFALGSFCLRLYIGPALTPLIGQRDPRWLGAWWLGWVILGSVMVIFGLLIGLFPKNLPKKEKPELPPVEGTVYTGALYEPVPLDEKREENSLYAEYNKNSIYGDGVIDAVINGPIVQERSFQTSLKRILTNPLLMVNNFTSVFYIIGASGYINFFNKYTETQFHSSAASANIVAGVATLFSLVLGFLLSGWLISKYKPKASFLLLWNVGVGCIYMAGEIFLIFLGCPDTNIQGTFTPEGLLNANETCNYGCGCESVKYSPVCHDETQKTYFSACHAGCTFMNITEGLRTFSNCGCVGDVSAILTSGTCTGGCTGKLYLFMTVVCLMQMIGCTGRITNILINYRSVRPQDKAMAQGLALMLISLFAFIPGPILFGKIIDNACMVWDNTCGTKGNCWLYNKTHFRIYLNSTAAAFSFIAVVLDVLLWWLGKNIKLYEEADSTIEYRKRKI